MAKLIIMRGLPASGKSTRAEEILKASGNAVRINKDLLRTMLHFDKWTGRNEEKTRKAARAIAKTFLEDGLNVIIDDTNLNTGTFQSWKDLAKELGAGVQVENVVCLLETCLERDRARNNKVGRHVIIGMALQNGLYPTPKNGVVLCDIDGTLADIKHRLHFVRYLAEDAKKDWKGFFSEIHNDTPRLEVIDMLLKHEDAGREIILVSARPEIYREQTEAWLEKAFKGYPLYKVLLMRPTHDGRPDTEVKADILKRYFPNTSWIKEVIDDRPSVIRMWREKGLKVVDVGGGVEF